PAPRPPRRIARRRRGCRSSWSWRPSRPATATPAAARRRARRAARQGGTPLESKELFLHLAPRSGERAADRRAGRGGADRGSPHQLLVVAADLVAEAFGRFFLHRVEQLLAPGARRAGFVGARDADRIAVTLARAAHLAVLHRIAQLGQAVGGVAFGGG